MMMIVCIIIIKLLLFIRKHVFVYLLLFLLNIIHYDHYY